MLNHNNHFHVQDARPTAVFRFMCRPQGRNCNMYRSRISEAIHSRLQPCNKGLIQTRSFSMHTSKLRRHVAALASCGLLAACLPMCADEGMWTFDNPPVKH